MTATKPEPRKTNNNEEWIVHRTNVIHPDGTPELVEHRVKLADWPAYEREHNL